MDCVVNMRKKFEPASLADLLTPTGKGGRSSFRWYGYCVTVAVVLLVFWAFAGCAHVKSRATPNKAQSFTDQRAEVASLKKRLAKTWKVLKRLQNAHAVAVKRADDAEATIRSMVLGKMEAEDCTLYCPKVGGRP